MPGLGARALAGAVEGIGDSMVRQAQQRREDALIKLKQDHELNLVNQRAATRGRGGRGRSGRGSATTGPISDGPGNRRKDITTGLEKRLRELFGEDASDDVIGSVFEQAELWKGNGRTENDIFDILRNSANRNSEEVTLDRSLGDWWNDVPAKTENVPGDYDGTFTYGGSRPSPGRGLGPVQNDAPDAADAPAPNSGQANPNHQQDIADAREAIAQGVPREVVVARLRELGIDPGDL